MVWSIISDHTLLFSWSLRSEGPILTAKLRQTLTRSASESRAPQTQHHVLGAQGFRNIGNDGKSKGQSQVDHCFSEFIYIFCELLINSWLKLVNQDLGIIISIICG